MNINATLLVQIVVFIGLVWFTMKYVWPILIDALEERKTKIAEGLAAAERGEKDLQLAQTKISEDLRAVKQQASDIIDQAHKNAGQIVDDAKAQAREEGARIIKGAEAEITQMMQQGKEQLRKKVAQLAVLGATQLLETTVDESANDKLLDKLVAEL